ncbi:MAG: 8-oxoguanine deaminase [Oscillibacter sp.]|jgi:cytosine/adenosine deaminase-related metal-dependent hydrolase|nr:8-oxoguanine deaminase [Oscillibacter sp.]
MSSLLVKNIQALVSCDGQDRVYEQINLYCEDGLIRSIGPETPAAERTIDGTGMLCYPGLVNTHHHLYQVFSRNLPQVQNLELFDWLTTLYEVWKNANEDTIRLSSLTGMGELMKNGCTTVFDHHYVFPNGAGDLIGAQWEAAKTLGVRMHFSRGSMDRSKKDGGLPPDSVVQTVDEIMRDSVDLIQRYHDPSFQSMRRIALAPCSPFSVSAQLLKESALLAREYGVRLHTHLCETLDEERFTLETTGLRPLAYMETLGWVGPDVWYAHGIHFNTEELQLLADTGTGVCHCPVSNMKLSSGIARVPEMLSLGVPVGLGVDGSASNDGSNLLEEMRVCFLLHRLNSSDKAPSGYDVLKMATMGSARLLDRQREIGSLEVGKCADFFLVDSRRLELAGACRDPKSVLATVGLKQPVDYTVINGAVTVEKGRLTSIDEETLFQEADREINRYLSSL